MKKFLILSIMSMLAVTFASVLPQSANAQSSKFRRSTNGIANRYIVRLSDTYVDEDASEPSVRSEADHLKSQHGGKVREVFSHAMKGFVMEMNEQAAIALSKNSRVAMVEQDAQMFGSAIQGSATWGLDRIDQRGLPLNSEYGYTTDASNVHAYILDSGIRTTHIEFGGRASNDYNATADGQPDKDCTGHGTHVAGTVGSGAWGVAKNVRLHGVKVSPCSGYGTVSDLIEGMDWVAGNHIKPAVANISITAGGISTMLDTSIQNAISKGVTVVVAAANNSLDACNYSPARGTNVIAVGATSSNDVRAYYSNFGPCVDIWAPGTGITSTSYLNDFDARGMSGTSMASPHVAGVAALYLASNPGASPATVAQGLYNTSTSGVLADLGAGSPDRMAYSLLSSFNPTPSPTPTPLPDGRANHALTANGGTATVSSQYSSAYPASALINGDRKGSGWGSGRGGWNDATSGTYPDWTEIAFSGTRTIDEVNIFTLQDNYSTPSDPTLDMTFSQYGAVSFEVQYWTGSAWQTLPGANVAGNNKVWNRFTFAPVSTSKVRVYVTGALAGHTRLVEVEALGGGVAGPSPTPNPTPTPTPTPTPAPAAARVTIKKRAVGQSGESVSTVAFPYAATNFVTSSFSLQPGNELVDPDVKEFGSSNAITVTENQVYGWQLKSITCSELPGSGKTSLANSSTSLSGRTATIVVEEGENIECVFESEEIMPSAASVSVSGRVLSSSGKAVKGVQISIVDAVTGQSRSTTTNSLGSYQFTDLSVRKLYVITAKSTNKATIKNNSYTLDLTDDLTGLNFYTSNR
jgi:subtilisin family serine protease